jgi:SpoVK/Ycf46/Vps4 family AAA+-type ATPase
MSPTQLLNRWMYPLESRQDFCCLHTGQQFGVPFDQLIIFSTNLNPHSLTDEAFLRRIRHKIFIGYVTPTQYLSIFRKVCQEYDMEFDEALVRDILDRYYVSSSRPLTACHPRDLIENLVDRARFLGQKPRLTGEDLDSVCQSYFLRQADITNYDNLGNLGDSRPLQ